MGNGCSVHLKGHFNSGSFNGLKHTELFIKNILLKQPNWILKLELSNIYILKKNEFDGCSLAGGGTLAHSRGL